MAPSTRACMAVIIMLFLPAVASASGEAVTEAQAIRLFLEQSPQARRVPLIELSVGASRRSVAPISNPEVAYQVEDAAGVRDDFLTFQQKLPITGRRGLVRDSADVAASAAGLAAEQDLLAAATTIRALFYEILYREGTLDQRLQGVERLERVVEMFATREREGEGSGYDLLRSEQELADVGIATSDAEAALAVARSRFGAFFDPEFGMEFARLDGDLDLTGALPEPEDAIERALSQRGDLRALRADAQSLDLERRAARRRRFPEPTLLAGWKRTRVLGLDDTGFIASLTVPLPFFDRGQATTSRATADRERADLDVEILEREIRADVQAAIVRERAARQNAQRHGKEVERRAGELRRIAELSYDEGEAGILELLDAYRTSLAMELRALSVRYEAKRAEIDRDRAIGVEVMP
jgi:cobalt-zinc-cadmium efflux system outer membrane protein